MTVPTPVADYPRPRIPLKPVLSWGTFCFRFQRTVPSVLQAGSVLPITSGRVGIALALQRSGVGAGDRVLVPAYHCTSMVEPIVWMGAIPVFYRINADTTIDLADFEAKCGPQARAALVTHYFGFHQDVAPLREICDRHGLFLIEDCAHAFFGEVRGRPIGTAGDYAIASAMKFFAIHEGGYLVSAHRSVTDIPLHSAGISFEIKMAINCLEQALAYHRLTPLGWVLRPLLWLKDMLWQRLKNVATEGSSMGPGASEGDYEFEPRWLNTRMSTASRALIALSDKARIADRRRGNYLRLHTALDGRPGAKPLFRELPASVVPYVYPLLIDEPERVFPVLKSAGIPILRFGEYLWPGVDENTCPVTTDLSRRLFQFPCHQELRQHELDWMIGTIRNALDKQT